MKKSFFILAALWMAAAGSVKAAENEIYATKAEVGDEVIMYLHYDDQKEAKGGVTDWSDWGSTVTKVQLEPSMQNARPTTTNMWFSEFEKLTEVVNIDYLHTEEVNDMGEMFDGCSSLVSLDLSSFNTSNVLTMMYMFNGCKALQELNLQWFDLGKAQYTASMFEKCSSLTTIYCNTRWWSGGPLDGKDVFRYGDMFKGCTSLKGGKGTVCNGEDNIDILFAHPDGDNDEPGYFTIKDEPEIYAALEADGTTMTFYYDSKRTFRHGVLSAWGFWWGSAITKVVFDESFKDARPTNMYLWFGSLANITEIEHLDYLHTEEVTDMLYMFSGCKKLTSLDLRTFNIAKVTDMGGMFKDCSALEQILCDDDWSKSSVLTNSANMFEGCTSLKGSKGTTYDAEHLDVSYAHPDGLLGQPGYFSGTVLPVYTVTFWDWDATLLFTEIVEEGKDAKGPETNPSREGYHFIGWSKPITNITADLTVIAQYKEIPEGLESVQKSEVSIQKVLRDGQLFIERNGKTYNAAGGEVR
jgi:surface protein